MTKKNADASAGAVRGTEENLPEENQAKANKADEESRKNQSRPKPRNKKTASKKDRGGGAPRKQRPPERLAALDLGTNNCRLLIATPSGRGLRIIDAYSRIVRLGEGLAQSGALSDNAMARALDALKICSEKVARRQVTRLRCIATQACRGAENGKSFLEEVRQQTGLKFEIIGPQEEARLAVRGCAELLDPEAPAALIFDIGGGSTELSWVQTDKVPGRAEPKTNIVAWKSMPFGVVMLSEKWDGREISDKKYKDMVKSVREEVSALGDPGDLRKEFDKKGAHFLGTSGTITSIAGVHLGLKRYRRDKVDGFWLKAKDVRAVANNLRAMSFEERANEPCIGEERADLVVCGCAILEALLEEWPVDRIRVADRGLREGILADLARDAQKERRRKRRRGKRQKRASTKTSE